MLDLVNGYRIQNLWHQIPWKWLQFHQNLQKGDQKKRSHVPISFRLISLKSHRGSRVSKLNYNCLNLEGKGQMINNPKPKASPLMRQSQKSKLIICARKLRQHRDDLWGQQAGWRHFVPCSQPIQGPRCTQNAIATLLLVKFRLFQFNSGENQFQFTVSCRFIMFIN